MNFAIIKIKKKLHCEKNAYICIQRTVEMTRFSTQNWWWHSLFKVNNESIGICMK